METIFLLHLFIFDAQYSLSSRFIIYKLLENHKLRHNPKMQNVCELCTMVRHSHPLRKELQIGFPKCYRNVYNFGTINYTFIKDILTFY